MKAGVLVWRQNALVRYRSLEPVGGTLDHLKRRKPRLLEAASAESNHVGLIGQLIARWLADGIIKAADAMLATSVRDCRPVRRNLR